MRPPQPWLLRLPLTWEQRGWRPDSLGLLHREDAIDREVLHHLLATAWPLHCQLFDFSCRTQPEMHTSVVLGEIPGAGNPFCQVFLAAGGHLETRPDPVAIALCAFQLNRDPVARIA